MADKLAEIREGIAEALRAIPGWQVSPNFLANPAAPGAHVFPGAGTYHRTMGNGHTDWNMTVQAFAGTISDIGAQTLLDQYIADAGDYSVLAAIEADTTLGGVCDSVTVMGFDNYGIRTRADGIQLLAVDFNVLVLAGD